jgi:hypothetical protein
MVEAASVCAGGAVTVAGLQYLRLGGVTVVEMKAEAATSVGKW